MARLAVPERPVKYTRTRACRSILAALAVLLISLAVMSCAACVRRSPERAQQAIDSGPAPSEAVATLGHRSSASSEPGGLSAAPTPASGPRLPPLLVVIAVLVAGFFALSILLRVVQALIEGLLRLQRTLLRLLSVVFVATVLAGIGLAATS